MSVVLAGFFGEPADVQIPSRSLRRIEKEVWRFESTYGLSGFVRMVTFEAITTIDGSNISQITVETKGTNEPYRDVHEAVCIVYRNGRFRQAFSKGTRKGGKDQTLTAALQRIGDPIGPDA